MQERKEDVMKVRMRQRPKKTAIHVSNQKSDIETAAAFQTDTVVVAPHYWAVFALLLQFESLVKEKTSPEEGKK